MKVHLIQNSAISFSVCIENNFDTLEALLLELKAKYKVSVEKGVNVFTLRHHNQQAIDEIEKNKRVLLKQITPKTVQILTLPKKSWVLNTLTIHKSLVKNNPDFIYNSLG